MTNKTRLELGICLFLIVACVTVYWQVGHHDFVRYDDNAYITENPNVQAGLTLKGSHWAFTTFHAANWHPVTWLSHMVDCQLFGLKPGMHHVVNLLFHIANSLLLFLVFRRMTGAIWQSGFVAGLFALHPLHVESVAWVAERKDVLSTFFWLLTMYAYIGFVERRTLVRYLLIVPPFVLGLMSKPMLVTLPFVLLLMDYWPLRRLHLKQMSRQKCHSTTGRYSVLTLVWEKVPLLALSTLSSLVTLHAQHVSGAISSLETLSLNIRIANAIVSYAKYVGKTIWPSRLAVFYPHPESLPVWQVIGAGSLLGLLSFMVLSKGKRLPFLAFGWFWYIGTLVPVIGLVQVGRQAMADRYTYVPLIGLFIMLAWGITEFMSKWRFRVTVLAFFTGVLFLSLMISTWVQVNHWKDTVALFRHAANATHRSYMAHVNLGTALAEQGNYEEALEHLNKAVQFGPDHPETHFELANALADHGNLEKAISHFYKAVQLKPDHLYAHYNLGVFLTRQGRLEEAFSHYSEALRIKPNCADAHSGLGTVLAKQGNYQEAIHHFRQALRISPGHQDAQKNLQQAMAFQDRLNESNKRYRQVERFEPQSADEHYNAGVTQARQGNLNNALAHFREAVRIDPEHAKAHNGVGNVLARQGDYNDAIHHFREALRIAPDYTSAQRNLEKALARQRGIAR
jgi:tetratricopeptide (TPR) repeat protein